MNKFSKVLIASIFATSAGIAGAQTATQPLSSGAKSLLDTDKTPGAVSGTALTGNSPAVGGSTAAATSSDPYVQKREADAMTKQEYKDKKKAAKAEYKQEKAAAKSDARASKMEAKAERNSAIEADRSATPVVPGQQTTLGH